MEKKSGLQEMKMNLSELLKDKVVLETEKDEKIALNKKDFRTTYFLIPYKTPEEFTQDF